GSFAGAAFGLFAGGSEAIPAARSRSSENSLRDRPFSGSILAHTSSSSAATLFASAACSASPRLRRNRCRSPTFTWQPPLEFLGQSRDGPVQVAPLRGRRERVLRVPNLRPVGQRLAEGVDLQA